MKKLLLLSISLFLFVGCACTNMMSTPTTVVEDYLHKYQMLDDSVLAQLTDVLDMDNLSDENRDAYEGVIKNQYEDLSYKIKNETIDGDDATVEVEIEVYDYQSIINDADDYLKEHEEEFYDSDNKVDEDKYMAYKIGRLKDTKDKVKYTIEFTLTKDKNNKWILNDLSETDRLKLHGLYQE